jgi:hypothetical protein
VPGAGPAARATGWTTGLADSAGRYGAAYGYPSGIPIITSGLRTSGGFTTTMSYDIDTDTWNTARAAIPSHRRYPAFAVFGGKLYVAGGFNSSFAAQSQLYEYDPIGNSWATKTAMPGVKGRATAAATPTGLIVAAGQSSPSVYDAAIYEWTAGSNTWATKTATASASFHDYASRGCGDDQGRLYLTGIAPSWLWRRYDPVADAWTDLRPLPTNTNFPMCVFVDWAGDEGTIFLIPGFDGAQVTDTVWAYDIANDTWGREPVDPQNHWVGSGIAIPDVGILVTGGVDPSATTTYDTTELLLIPASEEEPPPEEDNPDLLPTVGFLPI